MKILALSDRVVERIYSTQVCNCFPDVDLVVGCGDLPFYYLEFVVSMLNVPTVYVHGNHDQPLQYTADGRVLTRAGGCIPIDGGAATLNVKGRTVLLAGLGGSRRYKPNALHQYTEDEMLARATRLAWRLVWNRARHGRYLDILVTHSPPYGIHDEDDLAHTGFRTFLRLMRMFRPRYLLHGHVHVYRRDAPTLTEYEGTKVVNVYPYRLIEVNDV